MILAGCFNDNCALTPVVNRAASIDSHISTSTHTHAADDMLHKRSLMLHKTFNSLDLSLQADMLQKEREVRGVT